MPPQVSDGVDDITGENLQCLNKSAWEHWTEKHLRRFSRLRQTKWPLGYYDCHFVDKADKR